MSIDKLKTKFFTGAWLTDVKHYFTKINEIIDYLNGTTGNGSYKVYTALLTQLNTDNPTVIILNNTIGNIQFTRTNIGTYDIILNGAFPVGKCFFISEDPELTFYFTQVSQYVNGNGFVLKSYESTSDITLATTADSLLSGHQIEIRVYN